MKRIFVALCLISLVAVAPAAAQPGDWPEAAWKKKSTPSQAARNAKRRAYKKRQARTRHQHRRARTHNARFDTSRIRTGSLPRGSVDQPQKCMPVVSVVGDQSTTINGAKAQAEKSWQQQVRFRNGELYADPRYAQTITYRCVDSSIRNIANRATEALGINSQFKRCSMYAVPCRAPMLSDDVR